MPKSLKIPERQQPRKERIRNYPKKLPTFWARGLENDPLKNTMAAAMVRGLETWGIPKNQARPGRPQRRQGIGKPPDRGLLKKTKARGRLKNPPRISKNGGDGKDHDRPGREG